MSNKYYYHFDLNFQGDYIRGYSSTDLERRDFAIIENPDLHINNYPFNLENNSSINVLNLSKKHIVCYYKINKD